MYKDQVEIAVTQKKPFQGIKNRTFLSELITLPKACVLDYMHLCLEGGIKHMLDLFFNSVNHRSAFYIAHFIPSIDKLLIQIKYPSSFTRTQRSFHFYNLYKASEYRNLAFYSMIYIFKHESLNEIYYEHLVKYILFLRILTKDRISKEEIQYSQVLINEFISDFETLYGTTNLKYNLHAHLHLPGQVDDLGPLHKRSAFAGEGAFHVYLKNFHGAVNICMQIANKISLKIENEKFLTPEEIASIKKFDLRHFAEKLNSNRQLDHKRHNSFLKTQTINFNQLPLEQQIIFQENNLTAATIECSNKIRHNRKCIPF